MDALLHEINKSANSKSYDEILTIANEILQILITDVSDLLKITEHKTDLRSKNHQLNHTSGQTNYEIKQKLVKSTNCNNDVIMRTKEERMISEIKSQNLQRDIECEHKTETQQSYLKFVAQIYCNSNTDDSCKNNECIINLEQQKLHCVEAQINCEISIEDFPRIFENNSSQSFIEQDSNSLEGQVKCEINREDLLRIIEWVTDLTYKPPDYNLNEQIDCDFNFEVVARATKCNFDLATQKTLMNGKGGQIHCVMNLEDLLKVAECKCDLGSDRSKLIAIEGQINCEMQQKDLLGATQCKMNLIIDQPGLNVTGQINCDVNLEDFLRYTECKSSAIEY